MKTKVVLLMAVMSISLFSVGFSSWITVWSGGSNLKIETNTGEVFDYSNIISSISFEKLQYNDYGFINGEEIGTKGYFTSVIQFNINEARNILINNIDENNNFYFSTRIILSDSSSSLISSYVSMSSCNIRIPSTGIRPIVQIDSNTKEDNNVISDFTFSNITSTVNYMIIGVVYLVDASSASDFSTLLTTLSTVSFDLTVEIKEWKEVFF